MINIGVSEEDIVASALLDYLKCDFSELDKKDEKAIKRVLAHYMTATDYNAEFGDKAWQKIFKLD